MFATLNGLRMFFRDEGNKTAPAILFLHGYPLNSTMWRAQIAHFSKTHRVIAPDLRGHGATFSAVRMSDPTFTLNMIADDVVTLLNHLGVSKATVCGLSMGGYLAFALWRRYSKFFDKLILVDTKATADGAEAKANRYKQADLVRAQGTKPLPEIMLPKFIAEENKHACAATLQNMILTTSPDGVIGALSALAEREDSTPTLETIHVPTMIVVGEKDVLTPPSDAQFMHERIAGSQLATIPNAGHLSPMEQPVIFNRIVDEFDGLKV